MNNLSRRQQNRLNKQNRALEAALKVFSEYGFQSATMEAIATEANLTKPTLYEYFGSKDELFKAMMLAPRDLMMLAFDEEEDDHVSQLWTFAWTYVDTVMKPEFLSLARLIIGDAKRFVEIGHAYQSSGPDRVLEGLTKYMERQGAQKRLKIEDPELAAEDFWGLILSAPRNKALHIPDYAPSIHMLARYVHNGMKVFLRAYSVDVVKDLEKLSNLIESSSKKGVSR